MMESERIRQMGLAIVFDVDGVLANSFRPHLESWLGLGKEYGIRITEESFPATFGRTSREIIREMWGPNLPETTVAEMDERKEVLYREIFRRDPPVMDGAVELIDSLLAAGFKLGVGSSAPPANVEISLDALKRKHAFSAIVTGDDVVRGKPDPQVYLLAAERLRVRPERCAVIEDAPAGVAAALAAGMKAIAITGTASVEELARAKLVVDSLRDLTPEAIARLIMQGLDGLKA